MQEIRYSETDVRALNEFRQALAASLNNRLSDRMIKFVAVMLADDGKPGKFKLFVRARHILTDEGAELETKVKMAQIRTAEGLQKIADGVVNELVLYFHEGGKRVIGVQKPEIIH